MSRPTAAPKEVPMLFNGDLVRAILEGRKTQTRRPTGLGADWSFRGFNERGLAYFAKVIVGQEVKPPCNVGDVLWVRETWRKRDDCTIEYRASAPFVDAVTSHPAPWRPSIHMPRFAARIFLRVKSVSVEFLPNISNDDVKAEGIPFQIHDGKHCFRQFDWEEDGMCCYDGSEIFMRVWMDIYGFDSWAKWVWKIEFERIENYSRGGAGVAEGV